MKHSDLKDTDLAILENINNGYQFKPDGTVTNRFGRKLGSDRGDGRVKLSLNIPSRGKHSTVYLYRFIAYYLWGDKLFEKGVVVRHLNDDCRDNSWKNLSLGTQKDNFADAKRNGVKFGRSGKRWDWNAVYWSYITRGYSNTVRKFGISPLPFQYIIDNHKPSFLQRLYLNSRRWTRNVE